VYDGNVPVSEYTENPNIEDCYLQWLTTERLQAQ